MAEGSEKLDENSIISLFDLELNEAKTYDVDMNLQIVQIKKFDSKEKVVISLTLRDSKSKYNGFLIVPSDGSEEFIEKRLINVKSVMPKKMPKQSSRVFMIKVYSILPEIFEVQSPALLIKDNEGILTYEDGTHISPQHDEVEMIPTSLSHPPPPSESGIHSEETYTTLKFLTTFSRNFNILVRVTKKSEIKHFTQTGKKEGKLFYFIVLDKDGSEMQATCFGKAVDKFYDIIQENGVYEIKGGYVKINDKKYTAVNSGYKIVLDETAEINRKVDDGEIKQHPVDLVPITEVIKAKLYSVLDLCGYVIDCGEKIEKNTRNGVQPMKRVIFGDKSGYKVELSLWRNYSNIKVKPGDIILASHVKLGDYNGRKLSTFDETSIIINPEGVKECDELRSFVNNFKGEFQDINSLKEDIQRDSNMESSVTYTQRIKDVLDSLDEVEDVNSCSKVKVTITQMIHNDKNFYMGCQDKTCKRKLVIEEGKYFCSYCKKSYEKPYFYYTISLRVKDCSTEHWIDIFGKLGETLLKMKPDEYKDILFRNDSEKLREISESIEFKEFYFWVKPKMQIYNNSTKKKIYGYKIEPVDIQIEARNILNYLKKEVGLI